MLDRAALRVVGAEDQAGDAEMRAGAGAHRAWLQRRHQGAAGQPGTAESPLLPPAWRSARHGRRRRAPPPPHCRRERARCRPAPAPARPPAPRRATPLRAPPKERSPSGRGSDMPGSAAAGSFATRLPLARRHEARRPHHATGHRRHPRQRAAGGRRFRGLFPLSLVCPAAPTTWTVWRKPVACQMALPHDAALADAHARPYRRPGGHRRRLRRRSGAVWRRRAARDGGAEGRPHRRRAGAGARGAGARHAGAGPSAAASSCWRWRSVDR